MSANVTVKCTPKLGKELMKDKEQVLEKPLRDKGVEKPIRDKLVDKPNTDKGVEKPIRDKLFEKPITDKGATFEKPTDKPNEGGLPGRLAAGVQPGEQIETRMAHLESLVGAMLGQGAQAVAQQPFIGEQLRPDLSQGALASEDDAVQDAMQRGDPAGKRSFDKVADA